MPNNDTGIDFVAGDSSTIELTFEDKESGNAINLSDSNSTATIRWYVRHPGTGSVGRPKSASMTISSASEGKATYQWQPTDLDPPPGVTGFPIEYEVVVEGEANAGGSSPLTSLDPKTYQVRKPFA